MLKIINTIAGDGGLGIRNCVEISIYIKKLNKKVVAYSCEHILKMTINFAVIINSKRERRNRR